MYLKLAWRNIWRNKRRTWITLAAIGFAVFFSCTMKSSQLGSYARMIDNVTRFYTGYIQVHAKGYWEEKTLDETFEAPETLQPDISKLQYVEEVAPRLESFALASYLQKTKGALVLGIDPTREDHLTNLAKKLISGAYLEADDKSVLMSEGLAKYLKMSVGDTLVMISQGYRGINSAAKYPVKGIVKFPAPDLNGQLIYLPLKEAQWFYGAENRLTSLALVIEHADLTDHVIGDISNMINMDEFEVMGWREMLPELIQQIEVDYIGGQIMAFILYVVIAFGIFGTFLMMANERKYEFGILMAIGMKRFKLQAVVFIETIIIAVSGTILGIMLGLPIIVYYYFNPIRFTGEYAEMFEKFGMEPIMPFSMAPEVFTSQAITVLIITSLLALYPLWAILKLKIGTAIRA